jgi:lambda family phage minor tail protein L
MAHPIPPLVETLSSLEPTSMVTLYEIDFRSLGLSPNISTVVDVDVGTPTGAANNTPINTPIDIQVPSVGTILASGFILSVTNAGVITRKASDTITFTPAYNFTGYVAITVPSSEAIIYFHSGLNEINSSVVWQSNVYQPLPILADGFEANPSGQLPRPRLVVANVMSIISTYIELFDDLLGAQVIRRRTFAKYLDPVNFKGGVNPYASPTSELPPDLYRINRKVMETKLQVEFELVAAWDIEGVQLPRRQVLQNLCSWEYRSTECSYTGGPVANALDELDSQSENDSCGKRLTSCKLRFPTGSLPFGGFPGAGVSR